jgi:hypothetical protein
MLRMMKIIRYRELFLLLLAAVLIRLPWLFVIPVNDAPDEINHLWVVDFLRTHLRLPAATEVAAAGHLGVYGSLPQFGYLPHILTSMLFSEANQALLGARCGSLLTALAAIAAAYFISREIFLARESFQIFYRHKLLALALPLLLVLQPQFVFVSCYCNNDCTVAAIAGWIVYLLIRCIKYGLTYKLGLLLGVLLLWLNLCKYSGLSMLPVVLAGVVLAINAHKPRYRTLLWFSALLIIPCTVLSSWWLIRNYYEFGGDVLGTHTMYSTWATAFHRPLNYYMPAWQILTTPRWWRMLFYSFWGTYGHMNKYLWRPVYFVYLGFTLTGTLGWWLRCTRRTGANYSRSEMSIWLLFTTALLINMSALVWAGTSNLGGPQGRYLFASLIPIDALLLAGLALLSSRWGKILVISFLAFNFAVCCGSWTYLYLLYGFQCTPPT